MDPEGGSFSRCVRHPSQIFTGFCSFCLAERLSSVDSAESNPRASCGAQSEIVEITPASPPDLDRPGDAKVRKTLLSLFQWDDRNLTSSKVGLSENGYECESSVTHDVNFDLGARVLVSGSYSARAAEKFDPLEDQTLKDKGASFRLSSMFSKRLLGWGSRNASKRNQMRDRSLDSGFADNQLESRANSRRSCDWSLCRDSGKASWEVPRHSWDGSTAGKAFTCSFACLDEPQDGSRRIKRGIPEGATIADPVSSFENVDGSKINNSTLDQEKPSSSDVNLGGFLRERQHVETQQVSVSGVCRKKSHRWSKVWDWSITSPFRDLVRKRGHVLERSLSESWREGRKDKNMETVEPDGRTQFYGNGHNSTTTNQCLNRIINTVNGDHHSSRLDWQKKNEFRFGRSRSVHYSSPGNLDSGLLRFYLTPLRSSRRSTSKGRTKTSRSFARGILGLY